MRIFQRPGSPYWWYDFTWQGNRIRKSSQKLTKREAAGAAMDHLHHLKNGGAPASGWRLTDALGAYWEDTGKSKRSRDSIWHYFESLSDIIGAHKPITQISNADLMEYRAHRRGRDGVQAHTINRDFDMLRAALYHARDIYGQSVPNLAWKKIKVAEAPHRLRFLTTQEFAELIRSAHPDLKPIIVCAVATGLRRENILEMTWGQVDLHGNIITVHRTKSGKPLHVRIAAPLRAELATMQATRQRAAIQGNRIPRAGEPVFDRTGFRRRWEKAVRTACLDNLRFHDLRHTFASWARMNGADLATIRDALDHSHISVTMRYAHINPKTATTAFDHAGDMMQTAQSTAQSIDNKLKNNEN